MTFTTTDAAAILNAGRGTAYAAWTPYFCAFTASPDGFWVVRVGGHWRRVRPAGGDARGAVGEGHERHDATDVYRDGRCCDHAHRDGGCADRRVAPQVCAARDCGDGRVVRSGHGRCDDWAYRHPRVTFRLNGRG